MDTEKIKSIMQMFEESQISKMDLTDGDLHITLEKDVEVKQVVAPVAGQSVQEEKTEEKTGTPIKSPIVGTYYQSSGAGKEPYVKVGDTIQEGDTICIIEAMKVKNEIKATASGKVLSIEVQDGDDIYIPRTSNHVSVIGEVYNEQSFVYKKGSNAKYYIKEVGGYTPNANKFRLYKVSVNGRAEKISNHSDIEPGDTIVVPRRIAGNDWITPVCDTLKGIASIIVMAFAINKW